MITGMVFLLFAVLAICTPLAEAKKTTPVLGKKNVSLKKGNSVKISIKNANPKKVRWTVNKAGKSVITLSSKKKKSVVVMGKKAGSATVIAKVTLKGKKTKTLKAKVKVSESKAEKAPGVPKTETPEKSKEPTVTPTPTPAATPTLVPTATPKYEYEIEVLNNKDYTLYNSMTILLHIKTDNPDTSSFKIDCGSGKYVYHEEGYYTYEDDDFTRQHLIGGYSDIHYIYENAADGAVKDGYVEECRWNTSGRKDIVIKEKVDGVWVDTDARLSLDLKEYAEGKKEWVKNVIKNITTPEMSSYEKMCKVSNYVMSNFKYPSTLEGTEYDLFHTPNLTSELCGSYWDTKRVDCVAATNIVGAFADELGLKWEVVSYRGGYFEAENCGGAYAGASHVNNKVYIDGKAYIFDGCPNANNSIIPENSWDYIL